MCGVVGAAIFTTAVVVLSGEQPALINTSVDSLTPNNFAIAKPIQKSKRSKVEGDGRAEFDEKSGERKTQQK